MAPKKKAAKNAFYFFMVEVRDREQSRGNMVSLEQASVIANPLWTRMSAEERKPYTDKAKAAKGVKADKVDGTRKFTSLGKSFAMVDAEEREKTEFLNIMKATIQSTISNLDRESSLKDHKFLVCHVNYFYRTEDNFYAPAEFALGVFNLANGILDYLHFFIEAEKIPLGLKFHAIDWSNRTHGIPVSDSSWTCGMKNYYDMFKKVRSFIAKHIPGPVPPIYTMFDSLNSNYSHSALRCALDEMCAAANEDSSLFRVYCLGELFFELRCKCSPKLINAPTVAIMKNEIEKDIFSYAKDIGCPYHEEKDLSPHCSLSMIVRWIFTICDHCCKHLDVKLQLGFHVPKEVDTNWKQMNDYVRPIDNPRSNECRFSDAPEKTPLTIIDHGQRREMRDETKREYETMRLPKAIYSDKIGAKFTSDMAAALPSPSLSSASDNDEGSGWTTVTSPRGKSAVSGVGKGRGLLMNQEDRDVTILPVSGRGRLLANLK